MFGIGIGIGIGLKSKKLGAASIYDSDAQAFFDRITAAGGTTSLLEKASTNQLVLDLKSANLWALMLAIYPIVGSSAAACGQNLKNSSFTGTFSGGWTFATTGATPNGTNAFMNTFFNASTNFSATSRHMSYYNRTNTAMGYDMGASIGSNDTMIANRFTASTSAFANFGLNAAYTSIVTPSAVGFLQGNNILNSEKLFKNGSLLLTRANAITNNNLNIFIGASDRNAVATSYTNHECAFASIGDGLTNTQAANFYTAVQTFNTSLSRQV